MMEINIEMVLQIILVITAPYLLYRIFFSYRIRAEGSPTRFERRVQKLNRSMVEFEYAGSNVHLMFHLKFTVAMFGAVSILGLGLHFSGFTQYILNLAVIALIAWLYLTLPFARERYRYNKKKSWIEPVIDKRVQSLVDAFWEKRLLDDE